MQTTASTQYKPIYKPNQLICGTGIIAIVTGWTPRDRVAKHFLPDEYAVIGQLYNPSRGISFLIRNLLANPHVRHLVIMRTTKEDEVAGACRCLADFFLEGFSEGISDSGSRCWVISSKVKGYIDIEIEREALEALRQNIFCPRVAFSISEAKQYVEAINNIGYKAKPWGEPITFPMDDITPTQYPGRLYGHVIEGRTIAETWVKFIHRIHTTGITRPTGYDGTLRELIDVVAIVHDEPEEFYFPEPNYLPCDRAAMEAYLPQMLNDAPYKEGVKYSYGQRMRSWFGKDQIEQCIDKLIKEVDTASAVISLWDVKDHEKGGSPCLNHVWLKVSEGELSLTATFRSNDIFSAWPLNAMGLRALQRYIRDAIADAGYPLGMGALITISQSAHYYDEVTASVESIVSQHYSRIVEAEQRLYYDPCGNFLIEVAGADITVSQTAPVSGEIVRQYRDGSPLALVRAISADNPSLSPSHAGYLGIELERASKLGKQNLIYAQDKLS